MEIRRKVVNEIKRDSIIYQSLLPNDESDIEEYITRIKQNGTIPYKINILAAANALQANIIIRQGESCSRFDGTDDIKDVILLAYDPNNQQYDIVERTSNQGF